jgi:hypothetical protein
MWLAAQHGASQPAIGAAFRRSPPCAQITTIGRRLRSHDAKSVEALERLRSAWEADS